MISVIIFVDLLKFSSSRVRSMFDYNSKNRKLNVKNSRKQYQIHNSLSALRKLQETYCLCGGVLAPGFVKLLFNLTVGLCYDMLRWDGKEGIKKR